MGHVQFHRNYEIRTQDIKNNNYWILNNTIDSYDYTIKEYNFKFPFSEFLFEIDDNTNYVYHGGTENLDDNDKNNLFEFLNFIKIDNLYTEHIFTFLKGMRQYGLTAIVI